MNHPERPREEHSSATNSNRPKPSLLLLEDDDDMRAMLAEVLREEGWEITECENVFPLIQACIEQKMDDRNCRQPPYDVIISDNRMPGMSAIKTMQMLHTIRFGAEIPPTILITAFGDAETHRLARELGAAAVLDKPFDTKELVSKVREFAPPQGP